MQDRIKDGVERRHPFGNYSEPCKLRQNMLMHKHIWHNLYGEVTP